MDDLKKMPAVELVAVNQCSGNRRGLSNPHVAGVEWSYGAMGCARWKGVRLKDVLDMVGLKNEAIEIAFNGADSPIFDKTPISSKACRCGRQRTRSTLIAYEMNGGPLPHFNGYPTRLVVPGWTGTYWMKHLVSITALTKPQGGFWMNPAYRIPIGKFPLTARFTSQEYAPNTPITEMVINSLISSHRDGDKVKTGKVTVSGLHGTAATAFVPSKSRRRRQDLDGRDLRPGSRPLCVPAMELRVRAKRGKYGDGQRHQHHRSDPDRHADLESSRLPQQRDAEHHAQRELGEGIMRRFVFAFVAVLIAVPAMAQEQEIKLKPGPGLDKVEGNCGACHSLAYIPMNSPFLNAAGWNAEVTKMIKAMGAPIPDDDAKAIADYLARNTGRN